MVKFATILKQKKWLQLEMVSKEFKTDQKLQSLLHDQYIILIIGFRTMIVNISPKFETQLSLFHCLNKWNGFKIMNK